MDIQIINEPLHLELYGCSGTVINHEYGPTGMKLMHRMWDLVKGNHLKNKGINVWVYEGPGMFAGVELEAAPPAEIPLELKKIHITKYGRYKHIGPYHKLGQVNAQMREELTRKGYKTTYPCLEIYGHATPDENEAETDVLIGLV